MLTYVRAQYCTLCAQFPFLVWHSLFIFNAGIWPENITIFGQDRQTDRQIIDSLEFFFMIISWVMTRETILSQTWSGPMPCNCFLKSKLQIIKLLYRLRISFWYASLVVVDVFAIFFYSIVHCPFSFMYVYCLRFWWLLTRPSKCTVDKKQKYRILLYAF